MVSRLSKTVKRATEAIVTICVVLVFFSVFLFVLNFLFPSGAGLYSIISSDDDSSGSGFFKQAIRRLSLVQGEQEIDPGNGDMLAATLRGVNNHVKSKRAKAIAWRTAKEQMPLYDRDSVQTFSRSSAEIEFEKSNVLHMRERSIVVIRQLADDLLLGEQRSVVVLVEGELQGTISGSGHKPMLMEVATPGAKVKSQSVPGTGQDTTFKVTVNPDKSSTVTVFEGQAEVFSAGKKVVVESNQSTLVPLYQEPHTPEPLQQAIVLKNPENARKYYYSKLPPKIRFVWDERPESEGYEFVLARDETFRDVVMEETLPNPEIVHGNLRKGTYYWKVKAQGQSGAGRFSGQRRLDVVKDRTPPLLRVQFPGEIVKSDKCSLKGKTEPGANVFVDGQPVNVSRSGQFHHRLTLQRGINVVVVEAVDRADNVAYRSQLIHGKF